MIEALKGLLAIESVADHGKDGYPYGPGPAKALEYTLDLCRRMGFRVKNADGKYGYAELGQGKEIIGVLSHLDVVPAGKGWDYPPYAGTVEDGRLYGRGTLDDKGPAVISIFAARDLADEYAAAGKEFPRRLRLIFGQTEENGDWYDMEAYVANEEPVTCGITPDGDFPAIYCEKGIVVVTLTMPLKGSGILSAFGGSAPNVVPDECEIVTAAGTLHTTGKPAHGCAPWQGENAIDKALVQLAAQGIPFAVAYDTLFGGDVYGQKLGLAVQSPDSGPLSLNVGMLRLEDGQLRLTVDIRHPETTTSQAVLDTLRTAAEVQGFTLLPASPLHPVYLDKNGPVMQRLLKAYRDETGDMSEPLAIGGGTYARAMDNIIAFGPNFPGEESREHEANEYITLANMSRLRRIYREAFRSLLEINEGVQ